MKAVRNYLELIKFEHTIFALPFAYLGMLLAANGFPSFAQFFWITVAMAAARTVAMGFNRIADRAYDARNPRTANRPLVTGAISISTAWGGTLIAVGVLTLAAWQLSAMTLHLLPIALLFLFGYSFTKRFTWLSHFILGFTDGLAPVGAWVAIRGSLFTPQDIPAWILLAVVTFLIGGFDLIYACQDIEIDREIVIKSIPARFGPPAALRLSAISHIVTILLLVELGILTDLSWPYWLGMVVTAALLYWEHSLVSPQDLSRINMAFFNINSYISVTLFVSMLVALYIG